MRSNTVGTSGDTPLAALMRETAAATVDTVLAELRRRARFIRVTDAGQRESHVHDVFVTKEAPNYRP